LQEVEAEDGDVLGDEMLPKISKKKVVKVEENQSKKEHVNVVFIGHVGKCLFVCQTSK
jgi:peptide chain release factor subunit 3